MSRDGGKGAYYVTTPIYYVNDRPHIGHCYTTLLADVAARFQRLVRGEAFGGGTGGAGSVFFLTGTDEHADKVVTSAAAHGMSPQAWADRNAAEFRAAFEFMNISLDDFIRTTEPRHKGRVTRYIAALIAAGEVYKGEYTGWYDEGQEEYVTETAARETEFKSVVSGRPLVKRTEACYFFRLSKYQDRLRELIEGDGFRVAPEARKSEVLGRLRPPAVLNDVPISRPVTGDPATQWGIRVPGDGAHRVYVWIDALFNYLTVVDTEERRGYWPADVHLIGKDILWFHAVIWPALLMALRSSAPEYSWVGLPRCVYGHGWWVSEGQKMSKSLGNFIELEQLQAYAERYGLDALRWYLVTQGPMAGGDADFSHAKFVEVYNADLANGFGNCVSRVGTMIHKYFGGVIPKASEWPRARFQAEHALDVPEALSYVNELGLSSASQYGRTLAESVDEVISENKPYTLAKDMGANAQAVGDTLYYCAETLRIASLLFCPAMPQKTAELWRRWNWAPAAGVPLEKLTEFGGEHALKPGTKIEVGEALFMRADPGEGPPR